MEIRPDESYAIYGAEALLQRLQGVSAEIEGVRKAEDTECVHRMRVATRRTRAALTLFAGVMPQKRVGDWQREVRRITRALGAARDTDVQIEALEAFEAGLSEARHRAGIDRVILRLRQSRAGHQVQVLRALERLEESRILDDMGQTLRQMLVEARLREVETRTPCVYAQAFLNTSLRLEEMMSYSACVQHPEQVAELHAMRIAAKRLRYTMEIFAPIYPDELKKPLQAVRKVQELLGDIHDCDVWTEFLPRFLQEEQERMVAFLGHARLMRRLSYGVLHLQKERRATREQRYGEFVDVWRQIQADGVWKDLGRSLRPPAPQQAREPEPGGEEATG